MNDLYGYSAPYKPAVVYRHLTDTENKWRAQLESVKFREQWEERFISSLRGVGKISENQAGHLRKIVYRYRRVMK